MRKSSRIAVPAPLMLSLLMPMWLAFAQTNPVNVANTGTLAGSLGGLAVMGNYLYLANNSGLQVFDTSNPTHPLDVGFRDVNQYAYGIAVQGDLAYVPYYQMLRIFDLSNPTNPVPVGKIDHDCSTVTVSGNLAFLGSSVGPIFQVAIYDVSNPVQPVPVSQFNDEPTSIEISGEYAYLVNESLEAVDISKPSTPNQLGSSYCQGVDLVVSGVHAYVACWTNGFEIYNVSNPTNLVSVYHSVGDIYGAVTLSGNYAYLVGFHSFAVFDVSDPTNATLVANTYLAQGLGFGQLAFAVAGGYAYLGYGTGLSVYSVGQTASPHLNITETGGNIICSWPTPASAFAVQQSPALNSADWTTLTNTSVVVGSQNQVTIPKTHGIMFYRLVSE